MDLINKHTSLESQDQSVKDTLDYKVKDFESRGVPVESGLADYISFGVSNIDTDLEKLSNYKKMIESQIKQLKEHKSKVQEECAEWLNNIGIKKLNGIACSSVTITKGKEATTEKTEVETEIFTMDGFQYTSLKDLTDKLVEVGIGVYALEKETTIKEVEATKDKVKINSKRK